MSVEPVRKGTLFRAVVLAGERPGVSALIRALGLRASVLVDVAGKPALQRVLEALRAAQSVDGGLICGPEVAVVRSTPGFDTILQDTGFDWLSPETGPSASAIKAIGHLQHYPVLLTTGDHALLTPALVDDFCQRALVAGGDIVTGLTPYASVKAAFPESRRTVQKYSDGAYCGTNLIAVMNSAGLAALEFWLQVEAWRKQPWKIARYLGPGFLLAYLLRRVSLRQALRRFSALCGCTANYVPIDSPRAAVDVDSVADRDLAEKILMAEQKTAA